MPILDYMITREDFDQKYKVEKEINEVYLTFCTVVHKFVFNMMENKEAQKSGRHTRTH